MIVGIQGKKEESSHSNKGEAHDHSPSLPPHNGVLVFSSLSSQIYIEVQGLVELPMAAKNNMCTHEVIHESLPLKE